MCGCLTAPVVDLLGDGQLLLVVLDGLFIETHGRVGVTDVSKGPGKMETIYKRCKRKVSITENMETIDERTEKEKFLSLRRWRL